MWQDKMARGKVVVEGNEPAARAEYSGLAAVSVGAQNNATARISE